MFVEPTGKSNQLESVVSRFRAGLPLNKTVLKSGLIIKLSDAVDKVTLNANFSPVVELTTTGFEQGPVTVKTGTVG
jgi:hypothetical protein